MSAEQNTSGGLRKHRNQREVVTSVTKVTLVIKVTLVSRDSTITIVSKVTTITLLTKVATNVCSFSYKVLC